MSGYNKNQDFHDWDENQVAVGYFTALWLMTMVIAVTAFIVLAILGRITAEVAISFWVLFVIIFGMLTKIRG